MNISYFRCCGNKDRTDISEFEDAISYKQQLDAGLFDSQDEMAAALDLKKSKLSKLLGAAKIIKYPGIINLFPDITKIKVESTNIKKFLD